MFKFQLVIFVLFSLFLLPASVARAVIEDGTGNNVVAKVEPTSPKPGELVTISLSGYGFDLDRSHFRWFKDTKEISRGFGQKTLSFQTGPLGQKTTINVLISYNSRLVAEKSFIFDPTDLKISWQAESLIPPFYQGRARVSAGSTIKLAAEPHLVDNQGRLKTNNELVYYWSRDGKILTAESGIGRNTIELKTEPADTILKINLLVETLDKKQSATETLVINLTRPRIIFYEKEPLTGTDFSQPIVTNYPLNKEEVTFQALPLFWPTDKLNQLLYHWKVNEVNVFSPSGHPELLVVRRPAGASGQSEIKLELKDHQNNNFQTSGRFNVKFNSDLLKLN